MGADSFIFDPELAAPEPPRHLSATPQGALAQRMKWLIAIESVAERCLYVSIIGFGLCLAGPMFTQVLLRSVFASPFVGIEELSLLFGAWFYFLGVAYLTRPRQRLPPSARS